MGKKKRNIYTLDSSTIGMAARGVAFIIKMHSKDDPCPKQKLVDETGFTVGQISTIIKYMRRCSEQDLEKFIKWYPISSKKGYFFPQTFEEFAPCYATLEKWLISLKRTIEPMRTKMLQEGIDWHEYLKEIDKEEYDENYLDLIPEINKDTAWFCE